MSAQDHTYAVILAGGGGTRLWPKSRSKTPKQFLKLYGNDTMLQMTAKRFAKLVPWEKIIVVTTKQYVEDVKAQLSEIPAANILAEPEKRDTAMAMLVAALYAKTQDPEAILVNDAADHIVVNEKEFLRLMKVAAEVAEDKEHLVSVGITPTFPSSAFGYIKVGQEVQKIKNTSVFKVDSFTEKPNVATARAFISTGKYFWNANNYVWSADALLAAFKEHMPEMYEQTRHLGDVKPNSFAAALPEVYKIVPSISIDYAISEKANNLLLIPGDFGWDDIGEWKVVFDLGDKNEDGNVIIGEGDTPADKTLLLDSNHNLVHVGDKLIATVGLSDIIIVDTPDILMIAPKNRSQDVKKLVEQLKAKDRKEYL